MPWHEQVMLSVPRRRFWPLDMDHMRKSNHTETGLTLVEGQETLDIG